MSRHESPRRSRCCRRARASRPTRRVAARQSCSAGLAPGDVFAVNDPYDGGVTHLNDIVLAMPVLVDSTLVAWTATIAHFNDVGGMVPGSMSTDAYEIFQEGIRIPAIKIIEAGKPNQTVIDIMTVNS